MIKDLNQKELEIWFDVKFRDELLIKSPRDKKAHSQILTKIRNNGNGEFDISNPLDKNPLREELKIHMAKNNLTIQDVAELTEKNSSTIWKFLLGKVKSQDRTIYSIKNLIAGKIVDKNKGKRSLQLSLWD